MARQIINASDTLPASRPKINDNFEELYARRLIRAGWAFATAAERDAAVLTDDDIGFVCRVASPLGYWLLRQRTPTVVWEQIGTSWAPVSTIATTGHDLTSGDVGRWLRFTAVGAKTCTVLTATDVVDGEWYVRNAATNGYLTLVAGSGVTLIEPDTGGLVIPPRGSRAIKRVEAHTYEVT